MRFNADQLAAVPYLDQYFGAWAILEDAFRAGLQQAEKLNLHVHLQGSEAVAAARDEGSSGSVYQMMGDTAIITISGPMMKQASSMSGGTSTVLARRKVRAAMNDPEVKSVLIVFDTPGGTVAGNMDLADDIAALSAAKPCDGFIEDMCASGGYWCASQCRQIFASNQTTLAGSIGTYMVLQDMSALAAKEGVKVHVIRAGEFKGAGVPGTEVSHDQLAEMQRIVDGLNQHFLAAVAKGRNIPANRVAELADGRVHTAADAQGFGLIDGIQSFEKTLSALQGTTSKQRSKSAMAENATTTVVATAAAATVAAIEPRPATYTELKAALPGADAAFIGSQCEANATTQQAAQAWMIEQNKRIEAAHTAAAQAKSAATAPGVEAVGGAGKAAAKEKEDGDPIANWNTLTEASIAKHKNRGKALDAVTRANPEAHRAYVLAVNAEANRPTDHFERCHR